MNSNPLIIEHLYKDYPVKSGTGASGLKYIRAVADFSLTLNRGEIFGLLGPNGAGKTSIISTVVTLEAPTSGTIQIDGYDNQKFPRQAKQFVGFVPQEIINHGYFNVEEILKFHSGYYGLTHNEERIEYLLNSLGLYEHRLKKVKQLSGGMKRRLLIAKALVHKPKLLLLDEPTAGVDIELRSQLWEFVKKLKSEGVTILLTTHYLEEAQELCDRVGIIDKGELKMLGQTSDLIHQLTCRKVKIFYRGNPTPQEYILEQSETLGQLLIRQKTNLQEIEDMTIAEGTLEEAFRRVIYT